MQPFAVRHFRLVLFLGSIGVLILSVVHVGVGTVALTPIEVIAALVGQPYEPFHRVIVWDLRLPRTLIALLVGGSLAWLELFCRASCVIHLPSQK